MKEQSEPKPDSKKTYTPPKLVKYGEVRSLTQAASTGSNEGSGGSGIMMPSDRNLKENIVRIGAHPLGIALYLFDFKAEFRESFGPGRQFGVMADEVETVLPKAVSVDPEGRKTVDYGMLGIRPYRR